MAKSTTWYGKFTKGDQAIFFRLVTPGQGEVLPEHDNNVVQWEKVAPWAYKNGACWFSCEPSPNIVYERQFLLKKTPGFTAVELHEQEKFALCSGCSFVTMLERMLTT